MRVSNVAIWLAALLAGAALGQNQPPTRKGPAADFLGNALALLHHDAVQKELKLTDEQRQQINTLRGMQPGAMPGVQLRNGPGVEKSTKAALEAIFKPAQLTRLKQIVLQAMLLTGGLGAALSDPDVAADLGLTDNQKKKVAIVVESAHKKTSKATGAAADSKKKKDSFDAATDVERHKALDARLRPLLTDEQKAKLAELQGEPFKALQAVLDEGRRKSDPDKGREKKEGS